MIRLLLRSTVLVGLIALALAGCADGGTPSPSAVFRKVTDATLRPGDIIPDPQSEVVLSVTGKLGAAAGDDDRLDLDLPTLESLGLVEMTVNDRIAEGRTVVFQGVLLRVLLDAAQIDSGATTLILFALNDYIAQIPIAEVYALPVLIATRADGQRMTIEHYGPLRIVYPFGLLPLQQAVHEPRSIWQLFRLRVE